jgi:hypothetical protein
MEQYYSTTTSFVEHPIHQRKMVLCPTSVESDIIYQKTPMRWR